MKNDTPEMIIEQQSKTVNPKFNIEFSTAVNPENFTTGNGKNHSRKKAISESDKDQTLEIMNGAFDKMQDVLFGINALAKLFGDQHTSHEMKLDEWEVCGIGAILRCLYDKANDELSIYNINSMKLIRE